jgi:hypothetical protein
MTDVTKIRIGLAMIGVVILAGLVGVFAIDAAVGKAVMFAIVLTALVRAYMLYRSLRNDQAAAAS